MVDPLDPAREIKLREEALQTYRDLGNRSGETGVLISLGNAHYFRKDFARAVECYSQSIRISGDLRDVARQAVALGSLATAHLKLGEPVQAVECCNRVLQLVPEQTESGGFAHSNMGAAYRIMGRFQLALEHYTRSLKIRRALSSKAQGDSLHNLAALHSYLGNTKKSIEFFEQALALHRTAGNLRYEAATSSKLGYAYAFVGKTQEAFEHYERAAALYRRLGAPDEEAHVLGEISGLHDRLGNRDEAEKTLDRAFDLLKSAGAENRVEFHGLKIRWAERKGNLQQAEESAERVLAFTRKSGDVYGALIILTRLAGLARDQGRLEQARLRIEEAIESVEVIRGTIADRTDRASYFAQLRSLYEIYVDILLRLHEADPSAGRLDQAFGVSETARCRTLLETLGEATLKIREGADPALLKREQDAQKSLREKTGELIRFRSAEGKERDAAVLAKEVAALTDEVNAARDALRVNNPRYAALTNPRPDAAAVRAALDDDTLLLEYILGEKRCYVFAVEKSGITVHSLSPERDIIDAAQAVHRVLTLRAEKSDKPPEARLRDYVEADARYPTEARALSRMILGPVAERLGKKRLLIVADGVLQYVPFAALPVPKPPEEPPTEKGPKSPKPRASNVAASFTPLIVDHEIVNLPSATVLLALRAETESRKPADGSIAVVADPVFSLEDPRVARMREASSETPTTDRSARREISLETLADAVRGDLDVFERNGDFRRLPGTRAEAEEIRKLAADADPLVNVDFEANLEAVTSERLGRYRRLHFATHAVVSDALPECSGLLFSLVDREGKPRDGILPLADIYTLKLNADLVVLSACKTALGKDFKGEGLNGLTRGFMYAGTPRVLAGLWSVNDVSTAALMKEFYRGVLTRKERPSAALRAAQLALWKSNPNQNPYFWAGFVLQGEYR